MLEFPSQAGGGQWKLCFHYQQNCELNEHVNSMTVHPQRRLGWKQLFRHAGQLEQDTIFKVFVNCYCQNMQCQSLPINISHCWTPGRQGWGTSNPAGPVISLQSLLWAAAFFSLSWELPFQVSVGEILKWAGFNTGYGDATKIMLRGEGMFPVPSAQNDLKLSLCFLI